MDITSHPDFFALGIVALTSLFLMVSLLVIMFVSHYRQRQRAQAMEREQLRISMERTVMQAQLEVGEKVMKEISQELHDNVGQLLSTASRNMLELNDHLRDERIARAEEVVSRALQDIRHLSRSMNGNYLLRTGFVAAIQRELNNIGNGGKISVQFSSPPDLLNLPEKSQIMLFRCVQESLSNVVKHSGATEVTLSIWEDNGDVNIEVCDNGCGISGQFLSKGLGLLNMEERIAVMGGKFHYANQIDGGFKVSFKVPFASNQ